MNIEERVIAIVADKLGRDVAEVSPEKNFVNDLGADSLDTVELLMVFEQEFKINTRSLILFYGIKKSCSNRTGSTYSNR